MSLWGDDFKEDLSTKELLGKVNSPKSIKVETAIKSKKVSLEEKMDLIASNVHRILGSYESNTVVIKTKDEFVKYIDKAIENGSIAIDTETNRSLDPITCKLVGFCIYTDGQKNAYVPINHTDKFGRRLSWQCTESDVAEQLERVNDLKTIYHNGSFDMQVLFCTTGFRPRVYWDTMIGARLLNENERAGLKQQYISKIDPSIERYSIEHLFGGIDYEVFPPELFALYAATDAYMTYKLYEYQLSQFNLEENKKLFNLFKTVEMPIVDVVADMELTGVAIDTEYADRLSVKYHKLLDEVDDRISAELAKIKPQIDRWKVSSDAVAKPLKDGKLGKSKAEQLDDPINIGSPVQMSILLYDILGSPVIDKDHPRATGEEVIKQMPFPICKLILERRSLATLINTFIDKLPKSLNPKDGRLHGGFHQLGTDTGRFSSTDPNLQNIPSGETSIRLMFKPTDGYTMIGSDYSAQEPRIMAAYAQDKFLLDSLEKGRDPYATIASKIYKNKYEDNLETYPDGSLYLEGKHRRKSVKSLLLGILYGMSVPSLAEKLKFTVLEAQKILDDFFTSFPGIKKWMAETEENAKKNGYVEDLWGRRRRLPDLLLPKYTVRSLAVGFNPLLFTSGHCENEDLIEKYRKELESCKSSKEVRTIAERAKVVDGIEIVGNSNYISRAERQCVNARIQGGAATMTKKAMILIRNDDEMKRLGFRLLLAVHDELIGEAPTENADEAAERLSYLMRIAAQPECMVTMKCDALTFPCWYFDVRSGEVEEHALKLAICDSKGCSMKEAGDLIEKMDGHSRDQILKDYLSNKSVIALEEAKKEFPELLETQLKEILFDKAS